MYKPGQSGNPAGKPKGCVHGRSRALKILDCLLDEDATLTALHDALEAEFHKNPVRFFRTIIMPLLPHEAKVTTQQTGPIQWTPLAEVCRQLREQDAHKNDPSSATEARRVPSFPC